MSIMFRCPECGAPDKSLLDFPDEGDDIVYFIQASADGPIKIGSSKNVRKRLREMQTSSSKKLNLIVGESGGKERESALHAIFHEDRIRGEWFKRSIPLLNYILELLRLKVEQFVE